MTGRTMIGLAMACVLPATMPACDAAGEVAAEAGAATGPASGGVDALPLRRGFYVRSDDSCATASNATLALVRRDGITSCDFTAIERIGESRYRVKESCAVRGAPPGHAHERDEYTQEYEILGGDRYRVTSASGESADFEFCPQHTLPDPWNSNDISDITG